MKRFLFTLYTYLLALIVTCAASLLLPPGVGEAKTLTLNSGSHCGSWQVIPSPGSGWYASTLAAVVALSAKDAWAVGQEVTSPFHSHALVEHWDGTVWRVVPATNPSDDINMFNAITRVPGSHQLWAVGDYANLHGNHTVSYSLTERWNGSKWQVVPSPNPGLDAELYAVSAISQNDIWAVGYFNDGYLPFTMHWNGKKWSIVQGSSGGINVLAISTNNVWALGGRENNHLHNEGIFDHWNGKKWSIIPSRQFTYGSYLRELAAIPGTGQLWAVGNQADQQQTQRTLTEHWDGKTWSVIRSPNPSGSSINLLMAVASVTGTSTVWVVGHSSPVGSTITETLTERWNGSSWSIVKSPSPGDQYNELYGVAQVPGSSAMWAVGYYVLVNALSQQYKGLIEYYC